MKFFYIILLSISLHAECNEQQSQNANELFYEATQTQQFEKQKALLERSLSLCFTHEVKVSLLTLQAQATQDVKEKIKRYNEVLEHLSLIKNQNALVTTEQSRINQRLAKLHESEELKAIYENKVIEPHNNQEQKTPYWAFILAMLVILWVLNGFLKKE